MTVELQVSADSGVLTEQLLSFLNGIISALIYQSKSKSSRVWNIQHCSKVLSRLVVIGIFSY